MKPTPVFKPLEGEKIASVEPDLRPFVEGERSARLHFFPGRHLTAEALEGEHQFGLRRLLRRGQTVVPGVVHGFEVGLDRSGADAVFTIAPGYGLTASGEELSLDHSLVVKLGDIKIVDLVGAGRADRVAPAPTARAGVLLLQPVSIPDDDLPAGLVPEEGFDRNFIPWGVTEEDRAFKRGSLIDAVRVVRAFLPEAWQIGRAS